MNLTRYPGIAIILSLAPASLLADVALEQTMKIEAREWDNEFHCFDLRADPGEDVNLGEAACAPLPAVARETFGPMPFQEWPSQRTEVFGHIPLPYVMGYDTRPLLTLDERKEYLPWLMEKEIVLFYEHDPYNECGLVVRNEKGKYVSGETFPLSELG